MKKTIFTVLITAGVMLAGVAIAQSHSTLEVVEQTTLPHYSDFYKVYDNNNHAVCYVLRSGAAGAISCLK